MIRVLIADDEAPARRKLRVLLSRERDVEVVTEAADGGQAVAAIREYRPDVVFLDIQMPQLDGFGVIGEIGVDQMPAVVFVTAFDEHAVKAFEVQAVDYLLKPFAPKRLELLVERLRRGVLARQGSPADLATRIEGLLAAIAPPPQYLRQLLLERDAGRQIVVAIAEIDLIRADANYLHFVTRQGEFRRRGTLAELESRLDPGMFVRLNRSEIVRLEAIRELQPWFHGDARVVLHTGEVCQWSRRYRTRADELF